MLGYALVIGLTLGILTHAIGYMTHLPYSCPQAFAYEHGVNRSVIFRHETFQVGDNLRQILDACLDLGFGVTGELL